MSETSVGPAAPSVAERTRDNLAYLRAIEQRTT
jgi:hypothetical protein